MANEYPFKPTLKKVYWKDIRKEAHSVVPVISKLIDEIDPGKDYPLYEACYPYGSLILKKGICYYPNAEGKLVTLDDQSLPPDVKKYLAYTNPGFPAGIVLHNTIESYTPIVNNRIVLQNLLPTGYTFALWRFLELQPSFHPANIFNITAGARSIFLLPNIGDHFYHKNLRREFDIRMSPRKDLFSQWELFTALANHPAAKCDWHTKLLYFSNKWVERFVSTDKNWYALSNHLFKISWQKTAFFRNKLIYDFCFSQIQTTRHLKPNPYVADTAKHILAIAVEALPGFVPAHNNLYAPIDILQKIFLDIYKLKDYTPTFLQPQFFSKSLPSRPVYYSLSLPTSLEFSPHCRKTRTNLSDIRELAYLIDIYLEEMQKEYLGVENTPLALVANDIDFSYYHDKYDQEKRAKHTSEMPITDPTLISCPKGYNNITFPVAAPYIRGCVKISLKNKEKKSW